jgi:hypothetical protein
VALTLVFDAPGMTAAQYDGIMRGLEAAGEGTPRGRLFHVASPKPDGWLVVDVWESQETLDRFANTLMPLIQQTGVDVRPQAYPVHNRIVG